VRDVDWSNFLAEYRWVDGGAADWLARLAAAVGPTFDESRAKQPDDNVTEEIDPAWLTATVLQLAEGMDVEHAYDRLPILADALQDAGCENEDILDHCRGSGPHVRGCWVVDLVLGKD
jgi:hypothetical protein